jgi:exosome complex component RRP43
MCACISRVSQPSFIVKLPKAAVSPSLVVEADPTALAEPIQLSRLPVSSTFSIFNNPDVILSDPNDTEESLAKESVTVVMDFDYNLCRIYKNGGTSIDNEGLKQCIFNAKQRTNQVKLLINEALV